jgi:hypothetical protein
MVFSHWLLDLIVHRPDLPVLPGNVGNLPLFGFGLWQLPIAAAHVELALALGGTYLYYRSARNASAVAKDKRHIKALIAAGATGAFLVLLLGANYFISVSIDRDSSHADAPYLFRLVRLAPQLVRGPLVIQL